MPLRRDTRVFISAVSKELGTVRKLVKKALEDSGYHAVEQDTFPLDYRALIDKLRRQIESCDAVIHIAGRCYGAEPREQPAETPRRSYMQLEYDLARELGRPIYLVVTDDGFPADDDPAEDEERVALQEAHRQALTDGRQDYLRAATREQINDKVRSLQLRIENAHEELERVDEQVAATGQHLGRRLAWVLAGVLAVIATLGYLVWSGERRQAEAETVESVLTQIAERFLDQLLANKEISADEARRRALAELPAVVGLSAAAIQQIIDKKIAPRVQDTALSPLQRAKAALSAGDYDAVFAEAGKQRAESRELAILEGTAALARFRGNPKPAWNEKALAAFQRILALSDAGAQPLDWAQAANWGAFVLTDMARYAEAEPLLRQAVKLREEKLGADDPAVAEALNNLALLLQATNRLKEAEPLMRGALKIDEHSYGSEHPHVAIRLNNLALLLQVTNRLQEAEPLMRRALMLREEKVGANDPAVAVALNNLALLLQVTNRLQEAEPLMRRALAIDEQSYGPEHPSVARDLNNLALLLQDTSRLQDAEALMRRALEIDEQSYGPEHPAVARDLNNVAQLLKATNRLQEAEPLMRRALAIDEQSYGPEHPSVARDLNNLALLLQDTNRLQEAERLMRRALEIDEQSYGPEHPDVAISLNNLAVLLQHTNRLEAAESLMRRALEIDEQSYGLEHPDVAIDLNNLAVLLQDTDRIQEAEPLLRRALAIDEQSYGPEHPDVARDLNNLAQLLKATDRLQEAEPLSRRMLAILLNFTRRTGHEHPKLQQAKRSYAAIVKGLGRSEAEIDAEIRALQGQYGATVD